MSSDPTPSTVIQPFKRKHDNEGEASADTSGGGHRNRPFQGYKKSVTQQTNTANDTPTMKLFREFAQKLDSKNDRMERLVKISRDITAQSKRVIFTAQRASDPNSRSSSLQSAAESLVNIRTTYFVPLIFELADQPYYIFLRAFSPGLQEYIEAVSFVHYINFEKLITKEEVENELTFESGKLEITISDYLLGIADLTGELMRYAINCIGVGDTETPLSICNFVRETTQAFSTLNSSSIRDFYNKLKVMQQSLQKIEQACYTITVRGSEIPKEMLKEAAQSLFTSSGVGEEEEN